MPSNHLNPYYPYLLLLSIFPNIRVFFSESVLRIRWPKCWSFSFSISPSNEYSGLISFRIDWFDLLEVQGILKSLLQHHSSKASILLFCILKKKTTSRKGMVNRVVREYSSTSHTYYPMPTLYEGCNRNSLMEENLQCI